MGNPGLDRAGYKQISDGVDAILLTSTSGAVTGDWAKIEVLSSDATFVSITAPTVTGSSLISSGTTYFAPWALKGKITGVEVKTGQVMCYERILL